MNCKLSMEELDSLLPLFNNNGFVDGPEFILIFYRLRDDYRSKLLSDRVSRERNNRLAKKMHHVRQGWFLNPLYNRAQKNHYKING